MKLIYIDESGTDRGTKKCVVACVIIDGDTHFRKAEGLIQDAIKKFIPAEMQAGFIYHAKDVYGKHKKKLGWDMADCNRITAAWIDVIKCAQIPFCVSWVTKPNILDGMASQGHNDMSHVVAFGMALSECDKFMELHCPGEIGIVVAEDNPQMRKHLRRLDRDMRTTEWAYLAAFSKRQIIHIKDAVHFCEKDEALLLQLSDVIAFVYRRYLNGLNGGSRLYSRLLNKPADWGGDFPLANNGSSQMRWRKVS